MKKLIIIQTILFAFMTTSCFNDVHRSIFKRVDENNVKHEVKYMLSGCCGCKTLYVNRYLGKGIGEQFVSEFMCGFGFPTKFLFQQTAAGNTTITNTMIAVYDSSFSMPVTPFEKSIFKQLDSLVEGKVHPESKRLYSEITGFRQPKAGEKTHPFAFGKKGKTINP